MRTLLIDNYDSFTYNLYQYLSEVNEEDTIVIKNDELTMEQIQKLKFDNIVISPGPGNPEKEKDFGVCREVIENIDVPILGVCLGCQGIGNVFGSKIIHANQVMHGRLSKVYHNNHPLFDGIKQGFSVVRYHSLILEDLESCIEKIAWCSDGTIMGIAHKTKPILGVQFHPESICTEYGKKIIENFRKFTESNFWGKQFAKNQKCRIMVEKFDQTLDAAKFFYEYYKDKKYAIWLDSSKVVDGFSRFSYIGEIDGPLSYKVFYNEKEKELTVEKEGITYKLSKNMFEFIDEQLKIYCIEEKNKEDYPFEFKCGFAGYLGYEMRAECDYEVRYHSDYFDSVFYFLDRIVVLDNVENEVYLVTLVKENEEKVGRKWFEEMREKLYHSRIEIPKYDALPKDKISIQYEFTRDYRQYIEDIYTCFDNIFEGESYEICLTNTINCNVHVDPLKYYLHLRVINPAPYSSFIKIGDLAIASASIERFVKITKDRIVETRPMKGTSKRSADPVEDKRLLMELKNDEKTHAENLMICDLCRNDLGEICEIGSVTVPNLMSVETYATVHQMTSTIRGKLNKSVTPMGCVQRLFPGGSMTGAPKRRTMMIIEELEKQARGIYSGTIGYVSLDGAVDFNIVIRTAVIMPDKVKIGVGGAIIAMSDPEEEYRETVLKGEALVRALNDVYMGEGGKKQNGEK